MENYFLHGNVIRLMQLKLPNDKNITGGAWDSINRSVSILDSGVTTGYHYNEFIVNIELAIKDDSISTLKHRLSSYVDNLMFANANKGTRNVDEQVFIYTKVL